MRETKGTVEWYLSIPLRLFRSLAITQPQFMTTMQAATSRRTMDALARSAVIFILSPNGEADWQEAGRPTNLPERRPRASAHRRILPARYQIPPGARRPKRTARRWSSSRVDKVRSQPIRKPPGSGRWGHPRSPDWTGAAAAPVGASIKPTGEQCASIASPVERIVGPCHAYLTSKRSTIDWT
jgi:hypothetical protein